MLARGGDRACTACCAMLTSSLVVMAYGEGRATGKEEGDVLSRLLPPEPQALTAPWDAGTWEAGWVAGRGRARGLDGG